jgi:hypothetical protein|nr:MAG TPA: Cell-membrane associated Mucin15 [Myoviridae sp. ct6nn14]
MQVSNIWGCVFSFMLPGMVLGAMAALAVVELVEARERRRARARRRKKPLYIEDLKEEWK